MIHIANPIYDTVFKYLLEDERIVKTFRQDMNVEDEFFRAIENRDTAIMLRDQRIEEQDKHIEEQDKLIREKDEVIRSSAKLLKQAGVSLSQIKAMTGLSEEEITRL